MFRYEPRSERLTTIRPDELDLAKLPLGRVPQKGRFSVERGNHDVGLAVAVDVSDGQPSPEDRALEPRAGLPSSVVESSSEVSQQSGVHREWDSEAFTVEDVTVGLNQVEPAVGVEVGQGDSEPQNRPGRFGQTPLGGGVAVEPFCDRLERDG